MSTKSIIKSSLIGLGVISLFTSCNINDILEGDATRQGSGYTVAQGLKTALENGIVHGVDRVSVDNGYLSNELIKIVLPEDVSNAFATADRIQASIDSYTFGFGTDLLTSALIGEVVELKGMKNSLINGFNSAAEKAAPASLDIFKTAILDISFDDADNILFSDDSIAATSYLKGKTFGGLTSLFSPMVDSTLELVNAASTWKSFSTSYNSLLSSYNSFNQNSLIQLTSYKSVQVDSLTTDLGTYVTGKALTGLFHVVGEEEQKIRVDPFSYVTDIGGDILEEIFGKL
jgi:hypothetical protein